MAGIRGIQGEQVQTAARTPSAPTDGAANAQKSGAAPGLHADTVVFQRTPQMQAQAEQLFGKFLDRLQQAYPELRIVLDDGKTDSSLLARTLQEMGDGYTLLISKEFMDSLGADEDAFRRKAQAVLEVVRQLGRYAPGAVAWMGEDAAAILVRQAQEKGQGPPADWTQRQEKLLSDLLPIPSEQALAVSGSLRSAYYQTASAYSRLASAKTKTAVQSVTSDVRRSINTLKMAAAYGDDQLRAKAKKALKSMERLLLLANKKMDRFDEERLTDVRRKRAQENQQKEREMQAALELKRRKTARATGDGAILTEGRLRNVRLPGPPDWAEQQRLKKLYQDASDDWFAYTPLPAMAAVDAAAASGGFAGGIPAGFQVADVVVF